MIQLISNHERAKHLIMTSNVMKMIPVLLLYQALLGKSCIDLEPVINKETYKGSFMLTIFATIWTEILL